MQASDAREADGAVGNTAWITEKKQCDQGDKSMNLIEAWILGLALFPG